MLVKTKVNVLPNAALVPLKQYANCVFFWVSRSVTTGFYVNFSYSVIVVLFIIKQRYVQEVLST